MPEQIDIDRADGGTLRVYDTGRGGTTVFWHHGTPNIGAPPAPLRAASDRLGIRWASYDRPGYGGSSPAPGRDVASAASYVATVADALGIERFGVMGHSGGAPHALACGALLPDRVLGVVAAATLAPYDGEGLDYFAGMADSGVATLRSALAGREERERFEIAHGEDYDPEFTPADMAALGGDWSWFMEVIRPAVEAGPGPAIDDDLSYVAPWGFDPAEVDVPVLLLHGGRDRVAPPGHSRWLADRCPRAELRLYPNDGHLSVLTHAEDALEWIADRA